MMSESVFSSTGKGHGEMKASELATRTNFILLIMYIFYLSSCFVTSLYCVCVYFWDMSNSFIVRQAKILREMVNEQPGTLRLRFLIGSISRWTEMRNGASERQRTPASALPRQRFWYKDGNTFLLSLAGPQTPSLHYTSLLTLQGWHVRGKLFETLDGFLLALWSKKGRDKGLLFAFLGTLSLICFCFWGYLIPLVQNILIRQGLVSPSRQ